MYGRLARLAKIKSPCNTYLSSSLSASICSSLCRHSTALAQTYSNMADSPLAINLQDVLEARERIKERVHCTPVLECSHLNTLSGRQLFFKCEQFQKTGSFKFRGATNAVMKLVKDTEDAGKDKPVVVTHSSGNHAQALALAAKNCGIQAQIVMPQTSPRVKIRAVEGYGGVVTLCTPTEQGRKDAAAEVMKSVGPQAAFVSSSNDADIMAGQGTIALEMFEQVSDLDAIVAAVSAGGFVAGIAVGAKGLNPNIKMFVAEPELADDCAKSLEAGKIIPNPTYPNTIADALRMSVCELTFPVLQRHTTAVITVSEEEIVSAMRLVWERMKVVIEPGAACAVAAVLSHKFREKAGPDVKRVGVVLCGGNLDLDNIPWIKK